MITGAQNTKRQAFQPGPTSIFSLICKKKKVLTIYYMQRRVWYIINMSYREQAKPRLYKLEDELIISIRFYYMTV